MERAYQEYTSSDGGNTFFPLSTSDFKNLFRFRNSFDVISSFRCASQLSCSVSISSFSSCFCSSLSFAIQASLSNGLPVSTGPFVGFVEDVAGLFFGLMWCQRGYSYATLAAAASQMSGISVGEGTYCPKKEVIDALDLGFFASSFARSAAFRLSDMLAVRRQ